MKANGFLLSMLFVLAGAYCLHAQQEPLRFRDSLFAFDISQDVQYTESVTASGKSKSLYMDIYEPKDDKTAGRPLIIYCHGGGFKDFSRNSKVQTRNCAGFASRGFVVGNIDYRTGTKESLNDDTAYFEAAYRAVQDAKAAARYFRKNAERYRIDTNRVYIAGNSAGGITALHAAYLGQGDVPSFVNVAKLGRLNECGWNKGYSGEFQGVINFWGAIWDYRLIKKNSVPVFCVHGMEDKSVPFDSSSDFHLFKYGSKIIYDRAQAVGILSGIKLFPATGHTLDNNEDKQRAALSEVCVWLHQIIQQDKRKIK